MTDAESDDLYRNHMIWFLSGGAEYSRDLVTDINKAKQELRPENIAKFREIHGEDSTTQHVADLEESLASSESDLSDWAGYFAGELGGVGDLPTKQPDGTWTIGSFSFFHWEYGFEVRAQSGKPVTVIDDVARIQGTAGADVTAGSNGSDIFTTLGGNDRVSDSGGTDTIDGGAGSDVFLVGSNTNGQYNARQSSANPAEWTLTNTGTKGLSSYAVTLGANGVRTVRGADGRVSAIQNFETVSFVGGAFGSDGGDVLDGGGRSEILVGLAGNDTLTGGGGNDTIVAGDGDDVIRVGVGAGQDSVIGGAGMDTIEATADNTVIRLSFLSGVETITANGHAGVTILGTANNDTFDFTRTALTGITQISSGGGNDLVIGSGGDDVIAGGLGRDVVAGAAGADRFRLFTAADSRVGDDADFIIDFSAQQGDRIDLQIIDPDPVAPYNQAFAFVGSAAFSAKGQVRAELQSDGNTHVYGTANGSTPYFEIVLAGSHGLKASDFIL